MYAISSTPSGVAISELNPAAPFGEAQPVAAVRARERDLVKGLEDAAVADDSSAIDVLIVHNPEIRQGIGGDAALAARVDLAVSRLNLALANSRVPTQVRLVHADELPCALSQPRVWSS